MNKFSSPSLSLRLATVEDIDQVLVLHQRYQVDRIKAEDKPDGFVTTDFSRGELQALIEQEQGLSLAFIQNDLGEQELVAYAMAASWTFWSQWPMFAFMMQSLDQRVVGGHRLSVENSYQYGPVCVDKSVRGQGVFEAVFEYSRAQMAQRFPVLVTFINKINPRSFQAHTAKTDLKVTAEFECNNNHYYELACLTSL